MIRSALTIVSASAVLLTASFAFAQTAPAAPAAPPDTSGHGSVAALVGYGSDDLKLGLGVRAGYTLPAHVYLGGTFMYHLGESSSVDGITASAHLFYFGAEGGYEIAAGPVIVRPYIGIGLAVATASVSGSDQVSGVPVSGSGSANHFSVWPGVTVLYPITPNFAVGADARFLIVSSSNSFGAFATGQYTF
jgi:hypothetical protein